MTSICVRVRVHVLLQCDDQNTRGWIALAAVYIFRIYTYILVYIVPQQDLEAN